MSDELKLSGLVHENSYAGREDESCEWVRSNKAEFNLWVTECGDLHYLPFESDKTPADARYKGCPYCVKPLVIKGKENE